MFNRLIGFFSWLINTVEQKQLLWNFSRLNCIKSWTKVFYKNGNWLSFHNCCDDCVIWVKKKKSLIRHCKRQQLFSPPKTLLKKFFFCQSFSQLEIQDEHKFREKMCNITHKVFESHKASVVSNIILLKLGSCFHR